jgi:hypothetical protein
MTSSRNGNSPHANGAIPAPIYMSSTFQCSALGGSFPRNTSCPLWVIPSRKKNRNGNERPNAVLDRSFTFWLLCRVRGKTVYLRRNNTARSSTIGHCRKPEIAIISRLWPKNSSAWSVNSRKEAAPATNTARCARACMTPACAKTASTIAVPAARPATCKPRLEASPPIGDRFSI